jgi:hypothetical protein
MTTTIEVVFLSTGPNVRFVTAKLAAGKTEAWIKRCAEPGMAPGGRNLTIQH